MSKLREIKPDGFDSVKVESIGNPKGLHVIFDYGWGTNVHVRLGEYKELVMSIHGWERLCELVDEYRSGEQSSE